MFLTAEQLIEVTGFRRPSAQVRWLSRAGMKFAIGGDGQIKVLRAELERYMLSGPVKQEPHLRLVGL
jgi:hypothetical protein